MPKLENNIIRLRAVEPSDVELLYNWENDIEIWNVSNTLVPFSKYLLQKYVDNSFLDIYETKQLRLMIDAKLENGRLFKTVGIIDIFDFEPYHNRAGVGILIHNTEDRRQHYAENALKVLIDYSFNHLKLHQLYCNILSDNTPSLNLFKKLGFEIIGEKKDWIKVTKGWNSEFFLQLINVISN